MRSLKRSIWSRFVEPLDSPTRDRVRNVKNEVKRVGLFLRGELKNLGRNRPPVRNVYHCCIQKTGSQWIKRVFDDYTIRSITGLSTHPQFPYENGYFKKSFPPYTFVPGLYLSYRLYDKIKKEGEYRTFYVVRDPRDIVVSWYYSTKYTHPPIGDIPNYRKYLNKVGIESGIEFSIRHLHLKISGMHDWWHHRDDSKLLVVRFEDLASNPVEQFNRIFRHCGYEIDQDQLRSVLSRYTKEKMRKRDLERRNGGRSHYRKDKKDWRELFTDRHRSLFKSLNGRLVENLGYPAWE